MVNIEEFKKVIEARIAEFEKDTSVEFVPVFRKYVSDYFSIRLIWAVAFFGLSEELFIKFYSPDIPFYVRVTLSLLAAFAVYLILSWRPLLRWFVPKSFKQNAIEDEAYRTFLLEEVFATQGRTGVLVLVAEWEREVFILADKGLLSKYPPEFWARLAEKLAQDFNTENPKATFLSALDALQEEMKRAFPATEHNRNELHNRIR